MSPEFTPRICPIACPISSTQILIMGGVSGTGKQDDVFVLDIEVARMQKVAEGGLIKFRSYNNSCAYVNN